jgi:hypothetical protein
VENENPSACADELERVHISYSAVWLVIKRDCNRSAQ